MRPVKKPLASAGAAWVRSDQPRQAGMDYWRDNHSQRVVAIPGFDENRQVHFDESNPGLWPATPGIETVIPVDRKMDGVADITFTSLLGLFSGRKETQALQKDEVNAFRRTVMYLSAPYKALWYPVAEPGVKAGAHAWLFLRRREGVSTGAFRKQVNQLAQALTETGELRELRTQAFTPWVEAFWNTPNVAHDNPKDQRFHASMILGFADAAARDEFFARPEIAALSADVGAKVSAIHAYAAQVITYIKHGEVLRTPER
ncbi:strictosidine synthase [Williamsia sp. M5A3_1d]